MKAILFCLLISVFAAETKPELIIAFVGDSLTEGLGVDKNAAYPALIEKALRSDGKNVRVINAGISGSTSQGAASRVRWVLKAKPNWIVLALGANDGLRGLSTENMKKNLIAAIDEAEKAKVRVLFAGMRVPPNFSAEYAKKFSQVFYDIAKERPKVLFVPFLLENVGGERDKNISDGIHPNEKGHKIMADIILSALRKHL
jgi:acyl-CoA thioesterase-1